MSNGSLIAGVVTALAIAVIVYGYTQGWFAQQVSVTVDNKTPPSTTPPATSSPPATTSGNTGIVPPASTPAPIAPPAAPKTKWMFYQGVDSGALPGIPGNDIGQFPGTLASIKQKCLDTPSCLGFNDNGWIKYAINPKSQWYGWTGNPAQGFRINVDRYPLFPAGGVPEYS